MKKSFYGWWVTAAAFITFGLSVGLPYYNISFFYDYFEKTYGWSKAQITFGFPLVFSSLHFGTILMYFVPCMVAGVVLSVAAALYPASFAARMVPGTALRTNI